MNEEILQNLNERIDQALVKGKELINDEDFQHRLQEVRDHAESTVRKHPVKSVLVGLAVGFLVGKLLSSDD